MRETYRVRWGSLYIGTEYRYAGELVPEIETWFAPDSFIGSGQCESVEVSDGEFREAVNRYCPELAEQLGVKLLKGVKVPEQPVAEPEPEAPIGDVTNPYEPGAAPAVEAVVAPTEPALDLTVAPQEQ